MKFEKGLMAVREERDNRPKRKTWLYLVGQIILWWYFHLVFRMKVVGAENVPQEGPVLLCSNHLAKRDPVLLGLCQKRQVFYMAKEELFRNKFLGGLFRMLGAFPVKRGTGGADALEDAYTLLEENGVVGVFIEGHRSKDGRLLKPKTGAALLAYKTKGAGGAGVHHRRGRPAAGDVQAHPHPLWQAHLRSGAAHPGRLQHAAAPGQPHHYGPHRPAAGGVLQRAGPALPAGAGQGSPRPGGAP